MDEYEENRSYFEVHPHVKIRTRITGKTVAKAAKEICGIYDRNRQKGEGHLQNIHILLQARILDAGLSAEVGLTGTLDTKNGFIVDLTLPADEYARRMYDLSRVIKSSIEMYQKETFNG